jgi:hypothetical protein
VTVKAASLVPLLLMLCAAGASARPVQQLLPLPAITAPPVPAPLRPPTNPGAAAAPPQRISPLLLQSGPLFALPQRAGPSSLPPTLPAPIDQQKTTSYKMWLSGRLRLFERSGVSPADPVARELQQQLLQLEEAGGSR